MSSIANRLTPADVEMFRRLRIDPELVALARIERVTDQEARQEFGLNGTGDNAGIVFPYVDAAGIRRTCRLRRDHPDMEDGKPVKKYLAPYGDRRHVYIVPGDHNLGQDAGIPVVLWRPRSPPLPCGLSRIEPVANCCPSRSVDAGRGVARIGKVENSKGERVDEVGPLPELGICSDGRKVYVLLDANCASNHAVQAARNALVRQLLKQRARRACARLAGARWRERSRRLHWPVRRRCHDQVAGRHLQQDGRLAPVLDLPRNQGCTAAACASAGKCYRRLALCARLGRRVGLR